MENLIHGPGMDTDNVEVDDERTDVERYSDLLLEAYEVCRDAQRILELKYATPEHTLLILEDCLTKIEDICSI